MINIYISSTYNRRYVLFLTENFAEWNADKLGWSKVAQTIHTEIVTIK